MTEQLTGIAGGSLPEAVREVKRWATKQLEVPAGDRHLRLLCGLATEEAIHALNADRGIARPTATALVDEGLLTEDEARDDDAVAALQREFHRVAIFVWRVLRHGPPAPPDFGGSEAHGVVRPVAHRTPAGRGRR